MHLSEPDAARRDAARAAIAVQREAIALAGLTRGRAGAVSVHAGAAAQLPLADLVIEAGPERLEAKQAIFADLLAQTRADTLLATASSAITMSRIVPDPVAQGRCLVAHPVNPPAVLRLIELVPAPHTTADSMARAARLFSDAAFTPVVLGHEIEGFVLNRLQGAVLREAYRLVADGVVDAAGLDTVMRLGLGPRWALSGPFETAELNTPAASAPMRPGWVRPIAPWGLRAARPAATGARIWWRRWRPAAAASCPKVPCRSGSTGAAARSRGWWRCGTG